MVQRPRCPCTSAGPGAKRGRSCEGGRYRIGPESVGRLSISGNHVVTASKPLKQLRFLSSQADTVSAQGVMVPHVQNCRLCWTRGCGASRGASLSSAPPRRSGRRAAGGSRPTTERQVVVFPHPDSPTRPIVSPSFNVKLTRPPPSPPGRRRTRNNGSADQQWGNHRTLPGLHVAQLRVEPGP